MDPNYDDSNRQIMPIQPVQTKTGFMDYIRQNKLLVAIALLILLGLLWWFFVRKPTTPTTSVTTIVPGTGMNGMNGMSGTPSKVQVTRTRTVGGGMF